MNFQSFILFIVALSIFAYDRNILCAGRSSSRGSSSGSSSSRRSQTSSTSTARTNSRGRSSSRSSRPVTPKSSTTRPNNSNINKQSSYTTKSPFFVKYRQNNIKRNSNGRIARSSYQRQKFLSSKGIQKLPKNFEVDHKIPLSLGGADRPHNMQILSKKAHAQKTKREREKFLSQSKLKKYN